MGLFAHCLCGFSQKKHLWLSDHLSSVRILLETELPEEAGSLRPGSLPLAINQRLCGVLDLRRWSRWEDSLKAGIILMALHLSSSVTIAQMIDKCLLFCTINYTFWAALPVQNILSEHCHIVYFHLIIKNYSRTLQQKRFFFSLPLPTPSLSWNRIAFLC